MAAIGRTYWNGKISVGIFSFPVRAVSLNNSDYKPELHLSHEKCSARLEQNYVCTKCHNAVGWNEMGRIAEFEGKEIPLSYKELMFTNPNALKTISIQKIVDYAELPKKIFLHIEQSYPLVKMEDDDGKAWKLFYSTLKSLNKVAIGSVVMRKTSDQKICLISAMDNSLILQILSYPLQIKHSILEEVGQMLDTIPVSEEESKMAEMLINSLVSPFVWDDFASIKDDKTARITSLIQKKAEGTSVSLEPPTEEKSEKSKQDLLEQLKAAIVVIKDKEKK